MAGSGSVSVLADRHVPNVVDAVGRPAPADQPAPVGRLLGPAVPAPGGVVTAHERFGVAEMQGPGTFRTTETSQ